MGLCRANTCNYHSQCRTMLPKNRQDDWTYSGKARICFFFQFHLLRSSWFQRFLLFCPYLGKWSDLTTYCDIVQSGWKPPTRDGFCWDVSSPHHENWGISAHHWDLRFSAPMQSEPVSMSDGTFFGWFAISCVWKVEVRSCFLPTRCSK